MFGSECTKNIDIDKIINHWRKLNQLYGENHYLLAGNLVVFLDEQITENPQNINVFISSAKSLTGKLLTDTGWETKSSEEILDLKFKNTANKLVDLRPDIDTHNPKVFQQPSSRKTIAEAAEIGKHGWLYGTGSSSKRLLKSKFKVNALRYSKKNNLKN